MAENASVAVLSANELVDIQRDVQVPFSLNVALDGKDHLLLFHEIYRLLPGRRIVARVSLANEVVPVVIKLFMGKDAAHYWERELKGVAQLGAVVPTPRILGKGSTAAGDGRYILFEHLNGQEVAADSPEDVGSVVELVAKMHDGGVSQSDIHLDNFIKGSAGIVAIDGDGMRSIDAASSEETLASLGRLLAQLPVAMWVRAANFLAIYGAVRGWSEVQIHARLPILQKHLQKQSMERRRRYQTKVLRDCTEFYCEPGGRRFLVCLRERWGQEMRDFAANPEAFMQVADMIKAGNTSTVVRIRLDGVSHIVKRYNIKSMSHRLRQSGKRVSRARNAWCHGHGLRMLGMATATPVLLLEQRKFGLRDICYLVYEDCGESNLLDQVQGAGLTADLLNQVVDFFVQAKAANLTHGDTKATNFLIASDQLVAIDLDGMHYGDKSFAADLQRFLKNWDATTAAKFSTAFQAAGLLHKASVEQT